jgi:hypothetical protein
MTGRHILQAGSERRYQHVCVEHDFEHLTKILTLEPDDHLKTYQRECRRARRLLLLSKQWFKIITR